MSAAPKDDRQVKFSLRIVMNKEKTKVLFAEADRDFTDVLLSFLTLPLGTIMRLIDENWDEQGAPVNTGSLNNLYKSLENLDQTYFGTGNEHQNECRKLKLNLDDTESIRYFICEDWECSRDETKYANVSIYNCAFKCFCGKHLLNREIGLSESSTSKSSSGDGEGVFTHGTASFLITDDLQVRPNAAGFTLEILKKLGFRNGLHEKILFFGFKEIVDLLKRSMVSMTPLTDLSFHKNKRRSILSEALLPPNIRKAAASASGRSKKMVVKATVEDNKAS